MLNFLQSIFYGIPSTKSYEAKLQDEETKYTVYLETIESDDFRRYNELKEYFANPANLKVGVDLPQKKRQLEREYQADIEALQNKGFSLDREFQAKSAALPKKEQQMKKALRRKKQTAKSKEECLLLKEEKLKLNKQIAMEYRHLKEEGIQLRRELETEEQQLKQNFLSAKRQLKEDVKQQKDELLQLKHEFKRLKNSKLIEDFFLFKKKNSKVIEEQERWISKFYEDFAKNVIDSRWSKKQVISELLINGEPYSPIEDQHIFSPNNIQVSGGLLKIRTRQETKHGLAWDKKYGFVQKMFSYTSGILNSSHSFKQMYGKFEAKVRVKHTNGTYHAFWLGSDYQKPHLNVFKFEGKNLVISAYANDTTVERKLRYKLKDDFYIHSLLWSSNKLVWLINGKKVFETSNMIHEPMYVSFSSGVYDKRAEPTAMYVDWVRCFRRN
jgi:hypothetical protein